MQLAIRFCTSKLTNQLKINLVCLDLSYGVENLQDDPTCRVTRIIIVTEGPPKLYYIFPKNNALRREKAYYKSEFMTANKLNSAFSLVIIIFFPPLIIELERFIRHNQSKPKHNKTLFVHSLISFHLFIPFCYCEIHCKILALEIISPAPYWICLRYLSISSNLCLM